MNVWIIIKKHGVNGRNTIEEVWKNEEDAKESLTFLLSQKHRKGSKLWIERHKAKGKHTFKHWVE